MLDAQFASLRRLFKCAIVPGENRFILQLKKELKEYFNDSRKSYSSAHFSRYRFPAKKYGQNYSVFRMVKHFPMKNLQNGQITRRHKSGRTCKRFESNFYSYSLPQSGKQERRPWRLRRRDLAQAKALQLEKGLTLA